MIIMCVDDEKIILDALSQDLADHFPHEIETVDNGEEALDLIKELLKEGLEIPVILSDQLMPGMKGDEFLEQAHLLSPLSKKIMLTGQASSLAVGNSLNKANLYRYISKPWNAQDLLMTVDNALKAYIAAKELRDRMTLQEGLVNTIHHMSEELKTSVLIPRLLKASLQHLKLQRSLFIFHNPDISVSYEVVSQPGNVILSREISEEEIRKNYPITFLENLRQHPEFHFIANIRTDNQWKHDEFIKNTKIKAIVCAPIRHSDDVLGYLYLDTKEKVYLNSIYLDFLELFLKSAGSLLNQAFIIERTEQIVSERTAVVEEQAESLQHSIKYARRIQQALLPGSNLIKKYIPETLVIYEPRDLVSGDFYWFTHEAQADYLSIADCSGDGIAGAFMAVFSHAHLTETITRKSIKEPTAVLETLHSSLQTTFLETQMPEKPQVQIIICKFDYQQHHLNFSSAVIPLIILRKSKFLVFQGAQVPVGDEHFQTESLQTVPLEPGDLIILATHGIISEFTEDSTNLEKNNFEKWHTNHFIFQWLSANQHLPLNQQEALLKPIIQQNKSQQLNDWMLLCIKYTPESF